MTTSSTADCLKSLTSDDARCMVPGFATNARNGVEVRYEHYAIHKMKWRNIVFQSTARSLRAVHRQFHTGWFVRGLSCQTDEFLESEEALGAHATPLCGRLPFDSPRAGPGCCEAPCQEQLPWPSRSFPP